MVQGGGRVWKGYQRGVHPGLGRYRLQASQRQGARRHYFDRITLQVSGINVFALPPDRCYSAYHFLQVRCSVFAVGLHIMS